MLDVGVFNELFYVGDMKELRDVITGVIIVLRGDEYTFRILILFKYENNNN